ncbi:ABC transporter ATP-binding protein [Lentibacillus sp.]|uniref:ABC transporter ATP-binding protein n=1 Tax=Lentibacillus sp. TaxID=1925746 RepID=UPI002B4B3748|nr:ABC transporter ATP-binding protein [Lentibacillus sp.]HLS09802.1 ABC transporter ATP-binding protein [Lentibacillus sp.]
MLKAENITKAFHNKSYAIEILNDISFSISKGEWVSIVGPSGTGKSTFLNIMSGLLQPDSGSVFFDKLNIYKITEKERSNLRRKHIGFVFQDFKLLPYYSVLDNVIMPLHYEPKHKHSELQKRARRILKMVGVPESLYSRLPQGLSAGEKQRAAIARALIAEPDVLICDEPTGNLDRKNRNQIIDLFSQLKEQGKTIILVTHDLEAANHGDKVYQLINGTLSPNEVKQ